MRYIQLMYNSLYVLPRNVFTIKTLFLPTLLWNKWKSKGHSNFLEFHSKSQTFDYGAPINYVDRISRIFLSSQHWQVYHIADISLCSIVDISVIPFSPLIENVVYEDSQNEFLGIGIWQMEFKQNNSIW